MILISCRNAILKHFVHPAQIKLGFVPYDNGDSGCAKPPIGGGYLGSYGYRGVGTCVGALLPKTPLPA